MVNITKTLLNKITSNPLDTLKTLSEEDVVKIIQKANLEYYKSGNPILTDNIYDIVKEYLENINPTHPILKSVGTSQGNKVKLPFYMASLDKIKNDEKTLEKFKNSYKDEYIISDKLDGISALLYKNNNVLSLYTRGDGEKGQDITHLINFIKNVKDIPNNYAVRGELLMSKIDFEKVSSKGANARNMVAGLVNSKVPNLELTKYIQFIAYELIEPYVIPEEQFKILKNINLKTVNNIKITESNLNINKLSDILDERRKLSEFEIDGIVIFNNKKYPRNNENPKHAFAFKNINTMEKVEVIVTKVEWNLTKDNYLIPVVNFNPVHLNGVMVKKATGFNAKYIKTNKIGPGSQIIIMRSGDVIPHIVDIITESANKEPQMPDTKYLWTDSGVNIIIEKENNDYDEEIKEKQLKYFFEKVDFKYISEGNISKLYKNGFKSVKEVLTINKLDIQTIFKEKMGEKLYNSIQEGKLKLNILLIMEASNTLGRGLAEKKLKLITENIPKILTNKYIPTIDELIKIKGIETKTAELFISNLPKFFEFIKENELEDYLNQNQEIKTNLIPKIKTNFDISKINIVFTGIRDKELEILIEHNGGKVSNSITKNVTHIIAKDINENTSKIVKGRELNIKIITLEEFKKLLNL